MSDGTLSVEAMADLAEVDPAFVTRALESGALGSRPAAHLTDEDEAPLRLLKMWESAGISIDAIGQVIGEGRLSFSFLDATSIGGQPERISHARSTSSKAHWTSAPCPVSMRRSV